VILPRRRPLSRSAQELLKGLREAARLAMDTKHRRRR
jgi:hypothetical protein